MSLQSPLGRNLINKHEAEKLIKKLLNDDRATFRDGQWEAIDTLVNQRRQLLVVQRTGWGKSAVYFISTRILRDHGAGITIIISPLLALMRNQIQAAERLAVRAETINSSNKEDWQRVHHQILNNQIDILLISPERFANEEFVEAILPVMVRTLGLFVVDEAHCISDWGHDFRPDYRRLINILKQMPPNVPVLGTTATANDRVIQDIQQQLGDIEIQRGTLVRESLILQTLELSDQAARLAWLAHTIPSLPGTGIVYVLTVQDAEQVSTWLNQQHIVAKPYYGNVKHPHFENSDKYRLYLENLLSTNKIKVLVATSALGMGYDKPDLGFVIHYQVPGSVIGYYQQVGRAGRGIEKAYGILLAGQEDEEIHEYFRNTAFPEESHVMAILDELAQHDGLSMPQLQERVNLRQGQIEKVLKYLSVEAVAPIIKEGNYWKRTPVDYRLDHEKIRRLTQQREVEWAEMQKYVQTSQCLMEFLRRTLNDPQAQPCGHCANCLGQAVIETSITTTLFKQAQQFLHHVEIPLELRKQMPAGLTLKSPSLKGKLQDLQAQEGRVLCRWGHAGWGQIVAKDKYNHHFRDELVTAMFEMITQRWCPQPWPQWLTYVPSQRRPQLVAHFAQRLAQKLQLPLIAAVSKEKAHAPQKLQNNSFHQCKNLDGVFKVVTAVPKTSVFLVDDMTDSGWTLTIVAALLRQSGSGHVFPVALATTKGSD